MVENEAAAKAGIALLRSENAGRATFLPLDTVQPGVFRGKLSGSARLASSLVQADARYSDIVSNLLGRIIVVDDINEASRVARDNGFRSKVVTLDGQVVNAGGSFTGRWEISIFIRLYAEPVSIKLLAAALPAAVSSAARVCSPASRSWRSCGSRLRNCRRSALPLRKRPTSANSRQML